MSTFITVSGSLPKETVVFEQNFYTYAGCLRFKLVSEQQVDWDSVYDAVDAAVQDAFYNDAYKKLLGENDEITKKVIAQAGKTDKVGLLTPEIAEKRIDQELDFNFNIFREIPESWEKDYEKMPITTITIAAEDLEPRGEGGLKGATRDVQEEAYVQLPDSEFLVDVASLYKPAHPVVS